MISNSSMFVWNQSNFPAILNAHIIFPNHEKSVVNFDHRDWIMRWHSKQSIATRIRKILEKREIVEKKCHHHWQSLISNIPQGPTRKTRVFILFFCKIRPLKSKSVPKKNLFLFFSKQNGFVLINTYDRQEKNLLVSERLGWKYKTQLVV